MNSVILSSSYVLVHTPDMVIHNGSTQNTERVVNPDSEYLKALPQHIRSFEQAVAYAPNQVYIGNKTPNFLNSLAMPWYDKPIENADKFGRFGQIMPQDEFYLLIQACDVFDVVNLEKNFVAEILPKFKNNPLIKEDIALRVKEGKDIDFIENIVNNEHGEGLYHNNKLVGSVTRGHDVDVNLSAHVLHENLVSKASSVLSLLQLIKNANIDANDVEYVIDCSEEACGDVNQRGGGNFAKAAAEIAGLNNATGSDVRSFCAGPAHAIIMAASLVKAGTYKCVAVTAGGSTAKLGMNGKDHVKKGLPVLEDVLGGFAVLIGVNDGVHPEINLDIVGRHTVGTGSSPEAVITSLLSAPLERVGLKMTDVDKYSAEMQNPDVTKPAGAGDVPLSNFKMIAALSVKKGQIERKELPIFVEKHGMPGWAPTQGHIPSGVPYIGFAVNDILENKINRAMIIGKGSLFLGRMTNLFDGVSFIIQKNSGKKESEAISEDMVKEFIAKAMRNFAESLMGGGNYDK
ncbi:MAG: glycine reductase [Christensenellaceae bacterium]|nr:glycine reductase [Christensenellaceae bacterium]